MPAIRSAGFPACRCPRCPRLPRPDSPD